MWELSFEKGDYFNFYILVESTKEKIQKRNMNSCWMFVSFVSRVATLVLGKPPFDDNDFHSYVSVYPALMHHW